MPTPTPSQIAALECMFTRYVREFRSDHDASRLVPVLLEEAAYAAGEDYAITGALFDRAFKAIELLALLPHYNTTITKDGFPETRYLLWRAILRELMRGSGHIPVFAKALLKRVPLSGRERTRLRDVLKDTFENSDEIEVRQSLFSALRQTTKKSEPLVVRAFLRTIVQKVEDDSILGLVLAVSWKK